MKIVPASFEILDHLDQKSLPARIEECGRICYKNEDKITPESAIPFVEKGIERGHNSVLEMGVVTLEVLANGPQVTDLMMRQPKYIHAIGCEFKNINDSQSMIPRWLVLTGSVGAWIELYDRHKNCLIVRAVCAEIQRQFPVFFKTAIPIIGIPGIAAHVLDIRQVEQLYPEEKAKHRHVAVKFVVNRAISHDICHHRAIAILMESHGYCNYSANKFNNEITFIRPSAIFDCEITGKSGLCACDNKSGEFCDDCVDDIRNRWLVGNDKPVRTSRPFAQWLLSMQCAESDYFDLLDGGGSPQAACTVLPNSCKTEIIVYANLEQWRHIFKLRCSKAEDPSMREVMIPLRKEFAKRWPEVFEND